MCLFCSGGSPSSARSLVCLLALAGTAGADGDPASDILIAQDVFLPVPAPSAHTASALKARVAMVFARRNRIKVAVVASKTDLGSVPTLFNKPQSYAKFLGIELSTIYVGPLLVVMPNGFGIYDGGRATARAVRVLAKLRVAGRSSDALTRAAATAVHALAAARALRSKDIHPPSVFPQTVAARLGEPVKLTYVVLEDSEWSKEVVQVVVGGTEAKVIRTPLRRATYSVI